MLLAAPTDPKFSDGGVRRDACMAGGKAAAEADAVTHRAVGCSACGVRRRAHREGNLNERAMDIISVAWDDQAFRVATSTIAYSEFWSAYA